MIEIENLTKRYGSQTAVADVSFRCETGTVTGFLGPNGAGKSTTMRILCGLTPATSGRALIDGVPYRNLPNPGRAVGVLLDASAQHAGRTGREVLTLGALVLGLPTGRVGQVLDLVGLDKKAADKRVGNYSLGMRQRLGLAHALLGNPATLVLDEPANGLDPEGIFWMRGLLREFADRGGTVLLSSHLLHEVEAVADHLVVIGNGKIAADGSKQELLAGAGTLVRAVEADALAATLRAGGATVTATADGALLVDAEPLVVGRAAAASGAVLTELRTADGAGLEALFLQLTATATAAAPAGAINSPMEVAR
ncbi:ATP-binding cassette domain-containing protein [Kineosporia sp. J2-2]|uniref:ATP-binding cassette domain-containing protein n=1 Tax=Kineosporia corallincola TaxID=2835133 RepID=A0ABS5T8W6_9ACTN|nr:ATP-binding cassette domain-containing protein [Kineosporia corallincola]MBT0767515.1 ATP-binding cassette domain-containing protein [Kineosporia corallincola]